MFHLEFTILFLLTVWGQSFFVSKVSPHCRRNSQFIVPLQGQRFTETVPEGSSKQRLDVYLANAFPDRSRSFLSEMCNRGSVLVNNKVAGKSAKVSAGDIVAFEIEDPEVSNVVPENIPLDILFEDDDIIVINKPQGMVVHPAPGSPNGTFVNALMHHLGPAAREVLIAAAAAAEAAAAHKAASLLKAQPPRQRHFRGDGLVEVVVERHVTDGMTGVVQRGGKVGGPRTPGVTMVHDVDGDDDNDEYENEDVDESGDVDVDRDGDDATLAGLDLPETPEAASATAPGLRPGVVHRLDKGTSGVLLAGKNPMAVSKLSALFAQRKVKKTYVAVCVGHPGSTTIVEPIGRSTKNRQLMTVYEGPPGKPAVTHVRTLAFDGKMSAALVRIETGRTHQIRVHLKHRRTPILGDEAYGNADWNKKLCRSDGIRRPLLHAYETEFEHPFTGQTVTIRAPIPTDMKSLIDKIRGTAGVVGTTGMLLAQDGLLIGSTEVRGREPGEAATGFVPEDRLIIDDEDWTSVDLPEEVPL